MNVKSIKRWCNNLSRKIVAKVRKYQDTRLIDKTIVGIDKSDVKLYRSLLENQLNSYHHYCDTYTIKMLDRKYLLEFAKQVIDQIAPLKDIVGIQPLTAPVGLIFRLQYTQFELAPTIDIPNSDIDLPVTQRMKLEVVRHAVSSETEKMQAKWSIESSQDLSSLHGIDIEQEIKSILAQEFGYEITTRIVRDILSIGKETTFAPPESSKSVSDRIGRLGHEIMRCANDIARESRRGAGNFLIMSPTMVSTFQALKRPGLKLIPAPQEQQIAFGALTFVGWLGTNETDPSSRLFRVYQAFIPNATTSSEKIIVGYKGPSGATDAGYIYSPYIPLIYSPNTIDPLTYAPQVTFLTKHARWNDKVDLKLDHSAYYRVIDVPIDSILGPVTE